MIEKMAFLISKAWSVLSFKITIDGYSFEIWQPFAYAMIIKIILQLIISDISWGSNRKMNVEGNEALRNRKYTPWYKKR
jgi:hypothetical protein